MRHLLIGILIILSITFVAAQIDLRSSNQDIILTTHSNISNFTQLLDTATTLGAAGECAIMDAGGTFIEFGSCAGAANAYNYNETIVVLGFVNDSSTNLNNTYANFWYNYTPVALSFMNDSADRLNATYADFWYNHSVANNDFNYNETLVVLGFVNDSFGVINATYADLWYNYTLVSLNFVNDSADRLNDTYADNWYNHSSAGNGFNYNETIVALGFVNDSADRLNDTYADFWYNTTIISGADLTNVAFLNNSQTFTLVNIFQSNLELDENINVTHNVTFGSNNILEYWNGSCFNTEVGGTLVQSIGCS